MARHSVAEAIDPKPLVGKLTPAAALCRNCVSRSVAARDHQTQRFGAVSFIPVNTQLFKHSSIPQAAISPAIQIVALRQIRQEVRLSS
jgi:hypothetical protein